MQSVLTNRYSNRENIQILNRVRLIAINGQLILILFATWSLDIHLPLNWLLSLLVLEVIFQLYCHYRVKQLAPIKSNELFVSIVFDSVVLAGIVYFSGGANNPFIYLLLISTALGTFMLTPISLLLVVIIQLLLYSLLNIYQRPLELGDSSPLASFHLHLAGMWVNFVLTVILIAIFGLLTRRAMLVQENKIQNFREAQLKDEQILSLGIMSASAAHELGTPLSTMAIIVEDLKHQELPSSVNNDMDLLATQIANCRQIIQDLNDQSSYTRKQLTKQKVNDELTFRPLLKEQLELLINNWLVYRPQVQAQQFWSDEFCDINQFISISVEQALTNLLNNAADASLDNHSDIVEIKGMLKNKQLVIEIKDYGKGLSEDIKSSLGASIQDTKKDGGLGWGLFLTNASIERVGGKVRLIESEAGGTITQVFLPLMEKK